MTKNKPIYHVEDKPTNERRGFTEPFHWLRSEHDKSVYFGHWVVIYFIMQSLLEKRSKNLPWVPSKQWSRQSAILFIWSRATVILTQTILQIFFINKYFHCKTGLKSFVYMTFQWHQMTSSNIVLLTSLKF